MKLAATPSLWSSIVPVLMVTVTGRRFPLLGFGSPIAKVTGVRARDAARGAQVEHQGAVRALDEREAAGQRQPGDDERQVRSTHGDGVGGLVGEHREGAAEGGTGDPISENERSR